MSRMQVRFLRTSFGSRVAYATVGSGPPLVMVPPWSSHLEAFWELEGYRRLSSGFATGHTVVMYDRWGTGLSDRTRDDLSLPADVQVLDDVLSHLRLRRAALFGSSHGAPAALEYAAANPRRVSRLVLYSMETGSGPDDPRWSAFRDLMLADWEMGSFTLGSVLLAGAGKEEISSFARLWRRCTSAEMAVGLQDAAIRHDTSAAMAATRVPTLVVSRQDDRLISAETSRRIAAAIPTAELVLLDGEAHLPHEGDVGSLVAAVLAFLEPTQHAADGAPDSRSASETGQLTEREREILGLLVAGATNRAIADQLVISVRTVERHTLNIYSKLGVRGRAEAISAIYGRPPGSAH
jgi:pimeloyl-ACP methyl ester carboxylesterase/DNA-binding CsgD family transcriptional regulator